MIKITSYKEIVTKTIIGKGKKNFKTNHSVSPENKPNTVLGCWIINHEFNGSRSGDSVLVNGSYDVNIWYSYDNDSKTAVSTQKINYFDKMNIKVKDANEVATNQDIIVRALKQPNVSNVSINNDNITLDIDKEMGVELIGDTIVKVSVNEQYDDYDELEDDPEEMINQAQNQIDKEVVEDYLNQ